MSTSASTQFLTISAIKERGWTDSAIIRFLGEPDQLKPNPRYRSAAPMKLYAESRVLSSERSLDYQRFQADSKPRRQRAQTTADKRRAETIAWAEQQPIEVSSLPLTTIRIHAIDAYNEHNRGKNDSATFHSEQLFLDRITVNHLRHACSNYEEMLWQKFGKVGTDQAYQIIKKRVLAAIAVAYPALAGEANRQMNTL